MDENNEQFVAYFVPTQATLAKRQEDSQLEVSYREEEEYVFATHLHPAHALLTVHCVPADMSTG